MTSFTSRIASLRPSLRVGLCATLLWLTAVLTAQGQGAKKPMDHDVYDFWNAIKEKAISDDGQWVLYSQTPEDGDAELIVKNIASSQVYKVPRGTAGAFEDNARHVVFTINPEKKEVRAAKLAEKSKDALPKNSLGIMDLSTGAVTRIERVKSFKLPKKAPGYVAYLMEKPADAKKTDDKKEEKSEEEKKKEETDKKKKKDKKEEGTPLVLRNLATGAETRFEDAVEYALSENGRWLIYTASNKAGTADGAFLVETATGKSTTLLKGKGVYKQAAFDEAGKQFAFVSNKEDVEADAPVSALYYGTTEGKGAGSVQTLAQLGTKGIPANWAVSENGKVFFSKKGRRLFFGTVLRPEPEKEATLPDDEKVVLDVWNWKDPLIQPMQLKQLEQEKKRSYQAVVHLADKRVVQLADEAAPEVTVAAQGEGDIALANSDVPYKQALSWDTPGYSDVYVINVNTGERRLVLKELNEKATLSPLGRYMTWWNNDEFAWYAMSTAASSKPVKLTAQIPATFNNELHDMPSKPGAYGNAGWTQNDAEFLVYDKFDVWATDPKGTQKPRNITEGLGRAQNLRLRYNKLDPEEQSIDPKADLILSAVNLLNKDSGFYRDRVQGSNPPQKLISMARSFSNLEKAEDSSELLYTRESFQEFPDLWVSDANFTRPQQVSSANPQQSEYLWGTAELTYWDSDDGIPLAGVLYKPENFDPNKKYPLLVYFYEKLSDKLHAYQQPQSSVGIISISFYVSRGYVVLTPDIPYTTGYPGESAVKAIVPAVNSLVAKGFIDKARVGIQGHSWGGYQTCYLVTETNIFAAAQAGAPVSNMVSAYGGIRWGTGMSRMFQYEKTQSRIGGTLWEYPLRYIENSPIFHVDKMNTPLMMLHNDQDGAVPWYQGIELFVAGRRLGKPIWMLNYNNEDHGIGKFQNKRDFAIRMAQFFDHYLKGAPAPVWMEQGIPAVKKGRELGLELVN